MRLEHLKRWTVDSEMLREEADLKTRRYFGGGTPETPVGISN